MNRKNRGFTLIELLVVIAIIGLLVSMLMPSLSAAREQAKTSVCMSNMKRLGVGMNIYINENREMFPPMRLKTVSARDGADTYINQWGRQQPRWQWFVDSSEVGPVIDPEPFAAEIESGEGFGDKSIGSNGESGLMMTNKYFICPTMNNEYEFDIRNGSYGYNYQYLGNSRISGDDGRWDNFPVGLGRIRSAGQTVLLGDSRGGGPRHGKHSYTLDPPRLATERFATKFGPGSSDVSPGVENPELYKYSPVELRHGKRGNVAFLDAHVEAMTLEDLGYQTNEDGEAMPILDPMNDTYTASNKLWNGEAYDKIAIKHRP